MTILQLTIVPIALLLTAACGSESQKVARSDAVRYYLNQGDYENAIPLLKEEIAENPSDDKSRILLASAYSGSVGINTIDCFEVLRPKLFDKPLNSRSSLHSGSIFRQSRLTSPLSNEQPGTAFDEKQEQRRKSIIAIERELFKFSSQASDALEIAFRLPHLAVEKRDRLLLALSILSRIQPTSQEYLTAQLYEGILSLIQFLNYFRDALPAGAPIPFHSRPWFMSLYCELDLEVLLPNLTRSTDYLSAAFNSLSNAGRRSENPIYSNLSESSKRLMVINRTYLSHQDLFELAGKGITVTKPLSCEK